MKTWLRISLFFAFLFLLVSNLNAQTIYFCEGVDDDGYPISEASSFTIPDDGGYLYVLVRLPYEISCNEVKLHIYRNGDFDNTIYIDTEEDWVWFWKEVTFYKRGTYEFYVYDCDDYELTRGEVRINFD
jgi:hypothetical protein